MSVKPGHIRTWADVKRLGYEPLTEAEEKLRDHCVAGTVCILGNGEVPPELEDGEDPEPAVHIRAEVLRYFILGGCEKHKTDSIGVWMKGAHITGTLDIDFQSVPGALRILNSRFDERFDSEQTRVAVIGLDGCHLNGWRAQGLRCKGSVFLRGIDAKAMVALNSAEIGGQLACEGAKFLAEDGKALNAQGVKTGQDIFLRGITAKATVALNSAEIDGQLDCDGAKFLAEDGDALNAQGIKTGQSIYLRGITAGATVELNSARIGGQLSCVGAEFLAKDNNALNAHSIKIAHHVFLKGITAKGTISLSSAQIGGQLNCRGAKFLAEGDDALTVQGAKIDRELVWRRVSAANAILNFTDAHAAVLWDDEASWPDSERVLVDGFTFDRIVEAPTDAKSRIEWICKGEFRGGFFPQPYTHLAKVLREMGHERDARKILVAREQRQAWHNHKNSRLALNGDFRPAWQSVVQDFLSLWSFIARVTAGYGHAPGRVIPTLLVLTVAIWIPAHLAYKAGDFAPNSGPILVSEGWTDIVERSDVENPAQKWSDATEAGRDWETFHALAYAADVVIPIIVFGQTEAWAPSTTRGPWGVFLWWAKWFGALFGWIVTAIGAAAIAG
ncbi:MAG: hypothetical protein AAGO57_08075, partial [Pseudomonadota bacterium]